MTCMRDERRQINSPSVSLQVYVKSTVRMKRTVLDYTWVTMLAEIGGYTGLLLGVSVVNVTSYVERLMQMACCGKKWRSKQRKKKKIEALT